jgi:Mg/Co/Ni transporter MgtE
MKPAESTGAEVPEGANRFTLTPELDTSENLSADDLRAMWMILEHDERIEGFKLLPRTEAEEFFLELAARDHAELLLGLPAEEQRAWIRLLAPDDAADLVQAASRSSTRRPARRSRRCSRMPRTRRAV